MIDISRFFDIPSLEAWQQEAIKTLKCENSEELAAKLQKKSFEGVDFYAYEVKTKDHFLRSFPTKRTLSNNIELRVYDLFNQLMLNSFDQNQLDFNQTTVLLNISILHNAGASIVQEIAMSLSLMEFVKNNFLKCEKIELQVSVDSLYFNNIAKLRSLRFIYESLASQMDFPELKITSVSSLREQTLYDPWMNMLRQTSSTAAAFIGGADEIRILPYDEVAKLYGLERSNDVAVRQSENVFHILNEESFLTQVKDPSYGSHLIEALTEKFTKEGFELFKKYNDDAGILNQIKKFSHQVELVAQKRCNAVASTQKVVSGINLFTNTSESLENNFKVKLKLNSNEGLFPVRRVSFDYELLRQSLEGKELLISILVYGKESQLSARIMFCANFIESLGYEAKIHFVTNKAEANEVKANIKIYCSLDQDYKDFLTGEVNKDIIELIAGKSFKQEGMINIFNGIDKFSVLKSIVGRL